MLRTLKLYRMPYSTHGDGSGSTVAGHTISFSSYPATLLSIDDFYCTSAGLVRAASHRASLCVDAA